MPPFVYDPKLPFFSIVVPTVETVRYTLLMEMLSTVGKPILFTGSSGVGKSVLVQNFFTNYHDKLSLAPIQLTFSAQTNSNATQ